ncbi:MAG TPA: metallophosphatase, partial [Bacteroidia bacterium]|nr:metallophosphatase [Bacteroidia bacterium]
MSNRRNFLKQFSAGTALLSMGAFPLQAFAKRDIVKITILHTNDVHSRVDPFPDNDPKFAGKGGVAQRAAIIHQIRNTERNVLLLDAGDMFQGTPYYNMFGGEVEIKLMSLLGYDAGTIGNHDFDNGIDALAKQLIHANFPLINSNYDFKNTAMEGKTLPHKIFEKDGIRIGVFGMGIELKGLVPDKLYGATIYYNPIESAAKQAHYLKKTQHCDLIICLSHLGYKYPDGKVSD